MIAKQCHKMEVAHPTGFEPVTSAFGGLRIRDLGLSGAFPDIPKTL
jgi:hypothetical protein